MRHRLDRHEAVSRGMCTLPDHRAEEPNASSPLYRRSIIVDRDSTNLVQMQGDILWA